YKEKVLSFLDKISKEARLIGAVNTIKVTDSKLEGFNTDGSGFIRHLSQDLNFNPENKKIAIIGAGGAARAISVYLAKNNAKTITLYDINESKLFSLVSYLKRIFKDKEFKAAHSIAELKITESNLLVNATPVGMKKNDPCLIDEKLIHKDILIYDLIYNPPQTKLLKLAQAKGAKFSNGLGMLLYQGALSFEIWTDKKAPLTIMRQALKWI
ncbi:MAG: shikimate dehydrogenase, partial [Candidatus Omnitrophica bacterium]|nr:shikimate dehydrogenase [Candidatus Omnitrophota bacterium]